MNSIIEPLNGYYSLFTEPFTPPISLTNPENIFQMDNSISDSLNNFQIRYARYMQCQDPRFAASVSDPSCNTNTTDSFEKVEIAYNTLMKAMQNVNTALVKQEYSGISNKQYDACYNEILTNYKDIVALRKKLDEQYFELKTEKSAGKDTSIAKFESAVYVNTLWIILATILIYFVFVGI
jgi:hypothetical protein